MAPTCVICNDSQEKNPACVVYPFPDKTERPVQYQKYLALCDLQEANLPASEEACLYICSTHFEPVCFDEQGTLVPDAMPSLNLERIEIEAYADEDFQMLEEYEPMFNVKTTEGGGQDAVGASQSSTVETLLVPKTEPIEIIDEITFTDAEVKTEAPEADEGVPDPFGNIEQEKNNLRYCILCGDNETKTSSCRLYLFPRKIPKIYRKWILAAGLNANQYKDRDIFSCQRHFPENGFFADGKFIQSWATPNLNLPTRPKTKPAPRVSSEPQIIVVNSEPGTSSSSSSSKSSGPQIIIKTNPQNRKNAEALNIDPDSYAKTFAKVVMELMPRKLNYNGQERPVTGSIVFQSNLF